MTDRGRPHLRASVTAVAAALLLAALPMTASAGPQASFATPSYVDVTHAGGEPVLLNTGSLGTLVYTTHQGTTHLYRNGIVSSAFASFLTTDRDQVFVWYSTDNGNTWNLVNLANTGVTSAYSLGFSDPDLTQDEGGTTYDTGINLVNDSIFGSGDGGRTWTVGNPDCHDGDRPWLAGGTAGTVFMATDTLEGTLSHQVFQATRLPGGLLSCSATGVPDTDGSTYSGDGKLLFDHHNGNLIEPAIFLDANGQTNGIGVSVASTYGQPFVPHRAASSTLLAHWPAIAIDSGDNVYVVWDTDDRDPSHLTGCPDALGNPTPGPLPNSIMAASSSDHGQTWQVYTVARPGNVRVLWPWVTAGDNGKLSVVWYQLDRVADPDCQPSNAFVYEAQVFGAQSGAPSIGITNASGRSVHYGTICQGGTTCVATGQDRRMGDFFTNAIDQRGCVIIATADTMLTDPVTGGPLPTARPLFIRQNGGPTLRGQGSC
jgi:hypothetical protein